MKKEARKRKGTLYPEYPKLIQDFTPSETGQMYVSDATYLDIGKGKFYYLFIVTDAYSRKIVGWWLSKGLKADSCVKALWMALKEHGDKTPLIHHSDCGLQYCSDIYTQLLKESKMSISMTQHGSPSVNTIAERVNSILKTKWLNDMEPENITQAREKLAHIIGLHNNFQKY